MYYRVPLPWLQVKLLRLLQYYPPDTGEISVRITLQNTINAILEAAQTAPKNVQHANAQNAILFEAINLAIHLDAASALVAAAADLLGRFLASPETNVRYLALDTMAHLAACATDLGPLKRHQPTILHALKDRDISVRRRALDLLYSMCDASNAHVIVAEMLDFLARADYGLREEMVLKIAILTERFATVRSFLLNLLLWLICLLAGI